MAEMDRPKRTKTHDPALSTRKALVWEEEMPPTLTDLFRERGAVARFLRYWIADPLRDLPGLASYHLLRLFSPTTASALGAIHYSWIRHFYKARNNRIAANLARIRPDLDRDAVTRLNWRNKGRVMAEFSTLHLTATSGRLKIEGEECLFEARAKGPVVVVAMHMGNWELIAAAFRQIKVSAASFYMPPESRTEHRIAREVRESFGMELFAPGVKGIRPALRRLAQPDGVVIIFGDEGFGGRIMAPFFDRPPHLSGNLAIAVRLARHAGARIVPCYVLREGSSRFVCRWLPAIELEPTDNPGGSLPNDVMRLNDVIEPVIRRHLGQWYFLDHEL